MERYYTPEFLYVCLNKNGIDYIDEHFPEASHGGGLGIYRVLSISQWTTPDGQQTWRFLCLINRYPIYLLSRHIDHTWDYITERAYGDHVK